MDLNGERYTVYLGEVKLYYFETGIVFLLYKFLYPEIEKENTEQMLNHVANLCYRLKKLSLGEMLYQFEKKSNQFTHRYVPLDFNEVTHKILGIDEEAHVELFFNSAHKIKNQCIIYHLAKIKGENAVVKGEFDKWLFNLRQGYKTSYIDNSSVNESQVDGIYTPYSYIRWSFCQEGLVCLYSDTNNNETNEFLDHVFKTNLK